MRKIKKMNNKKYMIIINTFLVILLFLSAFGARWWTGQNPINWTSNDLYGRVITTPLGSIFNDFVGTISGSASNTFSHVIVLIMYFNVVWFICIEIPMSIYNLVKGVFK